MIALVATLAVSMQIMVRQPSGGMSESLAVSADQGFQMTVVFELALQKVDRFFLYLDQRLIEKDLIELGADSLDHRIDRIAQRVVRLVLIDPGRSSRGDRRAAVINQLGCGQGDLPCLICRAGR